MDDQLSEAAILLMVRAGLIGSNDLSTVAEEYDIRASRASHPDERDRLAMTAMRLKLLAMDSDPPPDTDPEVKHRADHMLRRVREHARRDGGKPGK